MGPRRLAHPEPDLADVRRHRGLVAQVRLHVPPVRDAVRLGLDLQDHQRLRLHSGHPRRGRPERRDHGVRRAIRSPHAHRPQLRRRDRRLPRLGAPDLRRELPGLVARPARPGDQAKLRALRHRGHRLHEPGRAGRLPRGRDRHARPALVDPLDPQLQPVLRNDGTQRRHRRGQGRGGPLGADGPAAVLDRQPQLGLHRRALEDQGVGQERTAVRSPRRSSPGPPGPR